MASPGKPEPPKVAGPVRGESPRLPGEAKLDLGRVRPIRDPNVRPAMKVIEPNPGPGLARPDFSPGGRARFAERLERGDLDRLTRGDVARRVNLAEQYRLARQGDVARRMGLHKNVVNVTNVANVTNITGVTHVAPHHGPHHAFAFRGRIHPSYHHTGFHFHHYGPWHFARPCWYPRWLPWVHWSWHHHCHPLWDPRPIWCRPVVYVAATPWVWWDFPTWTPLPVVSSGTWVDVARVETPPERFDLQLLAVRFVDPGHPDEKLGPRYRVWFRNNSDRPITQPFNVTLLAGADDRLVSGLPEAGVRVTAVEAGDTQAVDIRLPFEVGQMARDAAGQPAPFTTLHVLVDANREVGEDDLANNGARVARTEILPVDPAAFEAEPASAPAGAEVVVAGEGFGPEPGKVVVHLGNIEMDAEILGWYDLGVRLNLPNLPLAGPTPAELIVVRGDGAAANPIQVTVAPPK